MIYHQPIKVYFMGLTVALFIIAPTNPPVVKLQHEEEARRVSIVVDGRESLVYQYGKELAIPHYWPIRSPSGKLLTVQHPDPYPHHRSLWIVDKVQLEGGPIVDFYHCWKNYKEAEDTNSGFKHFIRQEGFSNLETEGTSATINSNLQWIVNQDVLVLDESRKVRFVALENGEYFLDLSWTLTASNGDVKFHSDWVHYAWPYVRMHPQFSGDKGGTITDDQGRTSQAKTNEKYANWIDYSNTVAEETEGLAVFLYPDGAKHKWLTREYGTFGPRRADKYSGTGFTLPKGESIKGRVGILIHRGDVKSGRVAERYIQYTKDKL